MHYGFALALIIVCSTAGFVGGGGPSDTTAVTDELGQPGLAEWPMAAVSCSAEDSTDSGNAPIEGLTGSGCVACPETFFTTDCTFGSQIVCEETDTRAPCCTISGEVILECPAGQTVKNIRCKPSSEKKFCVSRLICA